MKSTRLFEDNEQATPAGSRINFHVKEAIEALLNQLDKLGEDYGEEYFYREMRTLIVEHTVSLTALRILARRKRKANESK